MFIGHIAVGFASKRAAPRASLGLLMAAHGARSAVAAVPAGRMGAGSHRSGEHGVHSSGFRFVSVFAQPGDVGRLGNTIRSALLGRNPLRRRGRGHRLRSGQPLDSGFCHAPAGSAPVPRRNGARRPGAVDSVAGTIAVESVMFAAGVWMYMSATRARDRAGSYGLWAFVAFMVLVYFANVFGSPPPSAEFLARFSLAIWLIPLWAWWLDRHRERIAPP